MATASQNLGISAMSEAIWDTRENRNYTPLASDLHLPEQVFLEGVLHNCEGFRILLKTADIHAETTTLRVSFGLSPIAYRLMDEGAYPASWSKKKTHWLTKVENSEYLEWFNAESGGIRQNQPLVHYAVYTVNECIDVIDLKPPKIEWL